MINVYPLLFLIFVMSTQASGAEFSSIKISDWKKEDLAIDHLRFTSNSKKELVIHLQVDSYDTEHFWREQTLKEDIEKMVTTRKTMSSFLLNH